MSSVYEVGTDSLEGQSPSIAQRLTVLVLYGASWVVFSVLLGSVLRDVLGFGPYDSIVPESSLNPADSLTRYIAMYWFTSMLFMGIPFGVVSWLALRLHADGQVVRWKWLMVNIVAIAPMLTLSWLLFRNLLFLP